MNSNTVKSPIKDTLEEDNPPNKGQAESTRVYTLYRKSPLKKSTTSLQRTKRLVPKVSLLRFYCVNHLNGLNRVTVTV